MDRFGAKRIIPIGAAVVGVGALLFGTGNVTLANVGRFLQGAGGAFALIGAVYLIQEIHDWLDEYDKKTGVSIPMHIDGASGGFVNPFLYPDYKWDFRMPRVQSINASGHKYGLVPPGLGWIVFKDRKVFNENLVFYVNYLGGEAREAE